MCGTTLSSSEKTYFSRLIIIFFLIVFSGCSKENDDLPETGDEFYKDALISADKDLLSRTWSLFQVGYEGKSADVPLNYQNCDRDFFQFIPSGTYREYIVTSGYECEKQILDLSWDLEKGIITLQNYLGQTDEMVIVQLNQEKLVFKMKMDIDDDSEMDILTFLARPYTPANDLDLFSYTFGSEINYPTDKIKFTWLPYEGFYQFDRYEIYRSNSGCSKANAQLVGTIKNRTENFYIDQDPPAGEEICYYLKIYNEKGLLGESELIPFFTESVIPPEVKFVSVEALNNTVKMEWQPYQGNYFSHYKITVRNYKGGSGSGYQEYPIKIIEDKDVTTFLHENPPRLKNPVYAIYAYNIFGNISSTITTDKNAWELNWSHPEVLNFEAVQFLAIDQDQPEIFLYGRETYGQNRLIRYNYREKQISATANKLPEINTYVNMQVYETENGQELFFPQGNSLAVYNAADLSYKYKLVLENTPSFSDFAYLGNNIFSFTDSQFIYTYKRSNANLVFLAKKGHFATHHGDNNYYLIPLNNNEFLVGHFQEGQSFKFRINAAGEISNGELVNIPVKSRGEKMTIYSPQKNYILNLIENKFYSTESFSLQGSFESPYFPSGISRDGNLILGTNNDPRYVYEESVPERKARFYNLTSGNVTEIDTKGFPQLLFENHLGEIISISSEFPRESLKNPAQKPDLFVEVVK